MTSSYSRMGMGLFYWPSYQLPLNAGFGTMDSASVFMKQYYNRTRFPHTVNKIWFLTDLQSYYRILYEYMDSQLAASINPSIDTVGNIRTWCGSRSPCSLRSEVYLVSKTFRKINITHIFSLFNFLCKNWIFKRTVKKFSLINVIGKFFFILQQTYFWFGQF